MTENLETIENGNDLETTEAYEYLPKFRWVRVEVLPPLTEVQIRRGETKDPTSAVFDSVLTHISEFFRKNKVSDVKVDYQIEYRDNKAIAYTMLFKWFEYKVIGEQNDTPVDANNDLMNELDAARQEAAHWKSQVAKLVAPVRTDDGPVVAPIADFVNVMPDRGEAGGVISTGREISGVG